MFIESIFSIKDNSGIYRVKCIKILGGSLKKTVDIGNVLITSVQKHRRGFEFASIQKAIILTLARNILRIDGSFIKFDRTVGAVLSSKQKNKLLGSRIFVPVAKELRTKKILKLTVMAKRLV